MYVSGAGFLAIKSTERSLILPSDETRAAGILACHRKSHESVFDLVFIFCELITLNEADFLRVDDARQFICFLMFSFAMIP